MRSSALALFAAVAFASGAGCTRGAHRLDATATHTEDEAAVLRLVRHQGDLVKDRNWAALYETYAPSERHGCPEDAFVRHRNAAMPPATDLSTLVVDELRVRVDGDTAYVTYVDRLQGTPVGTATDAEPDLYLRADGVWYDKFDTHASC